MRFYGSLRNYGRSHHQRQHETLDGMQVQLTGAVRPNADENSQISRSTAVWAA
jgi:hypothetical protein